ncbi:zf-HC2 domain-containing protein [Neomoorella carbonis]|uniref:zf-HC2 domain-containing protein n=1 Tax=Neomoorella carbonis TaxID=3062783 RepID=UPI003256387C
MQCREAREFFSPYLDGELSPAEREVFRQHLEECPDCCAEWKRWQDISRALRGLGTPVSAPPGFLAAANARLAARQRVRSWQGIRRLVAAAAAVALLAAGSLSYAARGLWQHLPITVAGVQQDNGGKTAAVDLPPGTGADTVAPATPGGATGPEVKQDGTKPDEGATPEKGTAPANAIGGNGGAEPPAGAGTPTGGGSGDRPTRVAGAEPYVARTFLSDRRQATSTMLKIAVEDMAGAKTKALGLAAASGAAVQTIADQDDGRDKRAIYLLKVAEGRAASLLSALGQVGQVTAQNTNVQDLSRQFSAALEQYQAKVAQVNAAIDPEERAKLTKEAKALEQQLSTWEEETKQHTIILWLETK